MEQRDESRLHMTMKTQTPDAPYSDTFKMYEAWVGVSKPGQHRCIVQKFLKLDFVKYTMFKSQILARSIQGYMETEAFWKNSAEQKGCFKKRDRNHRRNLSEANQQIQVNGNA